MLKTIVAIIILPVIGNCLMAQTLAYKNPPEVPMAGARDRPFNVKDYGAKGDGLAEDSAAFSKAIEQAIKSGEGSRVYIPGPDPVANPLGRGVAIGQGRRKLLLDCSR